MRRRERASVLVVLLLVLVLAAGSGVGCAVGSRPDPGAAHRPVAEASVQDDQELDAWGMPKQGWADTAGEFLVVLLFVGVAVGAVAAPFLLL